MHLFNNSGRLAHEQFPPPHIAGQSRAPLLGFESTLKWFTTTPKSARAGAEDALFRPDLILGIICNLPWPMEKASASEAGNVSSNLTGDIFLT